MGAGVAGGTAVGPVSPTDLLSGLLPSFTANGSAGAETSGIVDVLTDGLASTFTGATGDISTIYTMGNAGILTYNLDIATNPKGYDISNINVFASWRRHRTVANQPYECFLFDGGGPEHVYPHRRHRRDLSGDRGRQQL